MNQAELKRIPARLLEALSQYVYGKDELLRLMIVSLLSGGHVLIEGLPGTGKTLAAQCFARAIGGQFKRLQLTPDLLPGDITGFNLYRPDGSPEFIPGPLFANLVLADELNRTTARTQSAFLEAMQEGQVTVEGHSYQLPPLFMVVASQVPYGGEGTFQLAQVQADRFLFRLWSGYPAREDEARVLEQADLLEELLFQPVTSPEEVLELRALVKEIHVSKLVIGYILDLVDGLRNDSDVLISPSPRASLALYRGGRALALLEERDYVLPDDVRYLASAAFEHRVVPSAEAEMDGVTARDLVQRTLATVPVPRGSATP